MRLSDEIFENLLWSLGSAGPQRADELRRTPRVGSSGIAMLFPIKDGQRDEGRDEERPDAPRIVPLLPGPVGRLQPVGVQDGPRP